MALFPTRLNGQPSAPGFTLLELSIVLVIIGVVIGMGLVTLTANLQASQYNATVKRMDEIEKALLDFAIANNRIPCPADLALNSASTTYGFEAGAGSGSAIGTATGVCRGTGMLPQANFVAASGVVEGGLPTRALQLPDDYMYDGWGRRFRYAVDPSQTISGALPASQASLCASTSAITVQDFAGASRTTAAAYAFISHGANGHGAYTGAGIPSSTGSTNANELLNCHCNTSGWAQTYTPTYVEMVPTQDSANALNNFDDIVTFKEPWQLQAQNFPLKPANCNLLAVGSSASPYLTIYSFSGGKLTRVPTPATVPDGTAYGVDFRKDNQLLAVAADQTASTNEGFLYNVTQSGLTLSSVFVNQNYGIASVRFSPDSQFLAYGGNYPRIGVNGGANYGTVDYTNTFFSYGQVWKPDSSILYVAGVAGYSTVGLFTHSGSSFTQASTLDMQTFGAGTNGSNGGLSIDPSGNYLAVGYVDSPPANHHPIVIKNPATTPTLISGAGSGLPDLGTTEVSLGSAWSPDGAMLAVALYESGFRVYTFNSNNDTFTSATISGAVCPGIGESVAWTPDSQYLAVASTGSPSLCLYQRSGTTLTNLNLNNSLLPPGSAYGVAFTK